MILQLTLLAGPGLPAPQDRAPRDREKGAFSLLEVAEIEGQRARSDRKERIGELLLQLAIYHDPTLEFFRDKERELMAYGDAAIPVLIEALEAAGDERTRLTAGRIAARLLAGFRVPGPRDRVLRIMDEGSTIGKAHAALYLGWLGDPIREATLLEYLERGDEYLVAAALVSLGRLGVVEVARRAPPFLKDGNPHLRRAALEALDLLGASDESIDRAVTEALLREDDVDLALLALDVLERRGGEACVRGLIDKFEAPGLKSGIRLRILECLAGIARRAEPEAREEILVFFKDLLTEGDQRTVRKTALILRDLGDESGLEILTENLELLIKTHGKAEYFFRRGEILLRFERFVKARKDFQEGLRKDASGGRYGLRKIRIALARCFAGEGRFAEAERALRKSGLEDTSHLPIDYREFRKMAEDPRFTGVFERTLKK